MANRIPQPFIDDLLTRCDIVDIIDTRVPLRKLGSNYSALCPFHNEKSPSFTVSPNKQFYYCFGCGASGNVISFLMNYDRMEFTEAITTLATPLGLTIPEQISASRNIQAQANLYELLEHVTRYYQQQLRQTPTAVQYLKKRGITGQTAKEFKIGFAPNDSNSLLKQLGDTPILREQLLKNGIFVKKENGRLSARFRDRIMFPIRDRRGRIIGFGGRTLSDGIPKYLNSPETPLFHKGSELYGLYEARTTHREPPQLLVVEGYMDLITLAQHGIRHVVATLGTATTENHLKLLFRCTQEIIFCFDGDTAGKKAAWRALETALSLLQDGFQINFMFLPEGEDPDSMIRKEGTTAFQERIQQAMPLSEFFFAHISAELNLNHLDGKARLAKPASTLLSKMPNSVFRIRMFQRLAEIVRVEPQQLYSLAGIKQPSSQPKKLTTKSTPLSNETRLSSLELAIVLLLQNPSLAQTINDAPNLLQIVSELAAPQALLLNEILQLLQKQPEITTGMLLEHWRFRPENDQITHFISRRHTIPDNGIQHEFQGILTRLYQLHREQKIERLLHKANQQGLSIEEKRLLQTLIAETKT